ncbi:CHAT domain-containing protein [Frankia sp. CiP3]|uniref:CHAT domain-containing protein n=1 Tax=Frankia sp. CiP3 TaxID=2880971 RepID=UPI001EF6BA8A|nr:CHAT domain-containing protein [Frankia sp. CiP3]
MLEPIHIEPGTPLAQAIADAHAAQARANAVQVDAAYRVATTAAADRDGGRGDLWSAVAADHVTALRVLGSLTLALQRCNHYLAEATAAGADRLALWLERAQLRSAVGDARGAGADAAAVRAAVAGRSDTLPVSNHGRLLRVEALVAAHEGHLATAAHLLDQSEQAFRRAGDETGVAVIDRDRSVLAVREGVEPHIAGVVEGPRPETVSGCFRLALALKRQLRYEAAAQVMLDVTANPDLDPALRLPALHELAALLLALRCDRSAHALRPALDDAAASWPDPAAAAMWVADLLPIEQDPPAASASDRAVRKVQRLIAEGRLDEAQARLAELAGPPPVTEDAKAATADHPRGSRRDGPVTETVRSAIDRDRALWFLAAGELNLVRYRQGRQRRVLQEAVEQLGTAVECASPNWLTEVRVRALRLLGEAYYRQAEHGRAVALWAQAQHLEEQIAGRQISDAVRVNMLQAVPNEHDERIRLAAEAIAENEQGAAAVAALVVALEAARGAAILGRILPTEAALTRDLPPPGNHDLAWRWVRMTADRLPRAQVVWMMHATPDRVHHAVIGWNLLHHIAVDCRREELAEAVDELMASWNENVLESDVGRAAFSEEARQIATHIDVGEVIRHLPHPIRRIAIVAGGILSDIPFAALPIPGQALPIGLRFALSDLPCLSARRPLSLRARRLRGDRHLLVSPPADSITPARAVRGGAVLDGSRANPGELRDVLRRHHYHRVRIDCHGQCDAHNVAGRWLQLAPVGSDGRLHPEDLQSMDLGGCGTLILGACESGMASRVGRDERIGFVRAALHAGAASVVAARWVAADPVAATLLDRFQRYIRYLPRDLALQRAQLDVHHGAPGTPADLTALGHPARWACWTLYGDPGWQTQAGTFHRLLRRGADRGSGERR